MGSLWSHFGCPPAIGKQEKHKTIVKSEFGVGEACSCCCHSQFYHLFHHHPTTPLLSLHFKLRIRQMLFHFLPRKHIYIYISMEKREIGKESSSINPPPFIIFLQVELLLTQYNMQNVEVSYMHLHCLSMSVLSPSCFL